MSQTHETDTCEVLVVRNLNVAFRQQDAPEVQAVRQLSFSPVPLFRRRFCFCNRCETR